ncbi:hypothetical protein ABGB17_08495 [Sphaerisporangium sp. B11E5]|uniref:hypothetical protein n=1 Tax=Sphaerisporangium sp. B11E5 TaxID=3153563 RepID=UPI00325ECBF6
MAVTRMTATDPAPFHLRRNTRDLARAVQTLAGKLPARDLKEVLAKANRTAVRKGATAAFGTMKPRPADWYCFNAGDNDTVDWYPQGVASSSEAGLPGAKALAVTWYWKPVGAPAERGIRVTFLDTATSKYRHVLLVAPKDDTYTPINIHAGGVAWYGDLIYVPDTARGMRVFDTRHIYEVAGDEDQIGLRDGRYHAYGYRYVMPQVDAWTLTGPAGSARFSFAAVDRTTTPHSLVSGEFVGADEAPQRDGRVARWELGEDGTLRAGDDGVARAVNAFTMPAAKIQGGLCHQGRWYLSQAGTSRSNGVLLTAEEREAPVSKKWPIGPEDLTCWAERGQLWSVTEFAGRRVVFAVPL